MHTICGQNAELRYVEEGGIDSKQWALKGRILPEALPSNPLSIHYLQPSNHSMLYFLSYWLQLQIKHVDKQTG
jgi:hypothetical protein